MNKLNKISDLQYLAGFFDGEGTITICTRKREVRPYFHLHVAVVNANKNVVLNFKESFGGWFGAQKKKASRYKQLYMWVVGSRAAEHFLLRIVPFLKVKKEQAVLALEFQAILRKDPGDRGSLSLPEISQRAGLSKKMHCLNRGVEENA